MKCTRRREAGREKKSEGKRDQSFFFVSHLNLGLGLVLFIGSNYRYAYMYKNYMIVLAPAVFKGSLYVV